MLDPRGLRFCHAAEIKLGEVASLSILKHKPVIALMAGEHLAAMPLNQRGDHCEWMAVADLYGAAMVYKGVEFEVDPVSASEDSPGFGSLVRWQDGLYFNVRGMRGPLLARIADGYESTGAGKTYFARWRAVIRNGDREFVLHECDLRAD